MCPGPLPTSGAKVIMKTNSRRNIRRPCRAGLLTCESTLSLCPKMARLRQPILHFAPVRKAPKLSPVQVCTLHSPNPHGTALFCTVPGNQIFSLWLSCVNVADSLGIGHSLMFGFWDPCHFLCGSARPATAGLTFASQVPDLTLFNPFYPRTFHRTSPQFANRPFHLIPSKNARNSTYST